MVDVSPSTGTRVICYCDSCQAFARFLEREDILDSAGGTDIVQVSPSQLRITEGASQLRSMRLTEKGLIRWYTDCCKTPVGNTIGAAFPFIGVVQPFMAHDASIPSRRWELLRPAPRGHLGRSRYRGMSAGGGRESAGEAPAEDGGEDPRLVDQRKGGAECPLRPEDEEGDLGAAGADEGRAGGALGLPATPRREAGFAAAGTGNLTRYFHNPLYN